MMFLRQSPSNRYIPEIIILSPVNTVGKWFSCLMMKKGSCQLIKNRFSIVKPKYGGDLKASRIVIMRKEIDNKLLPEPFKRSYNFFW